jgi:hypothetical protein
LRSPALFLLCFFCTKARQSAGVPFAINDKQVHLYQPILRIKRKFVSCLCTVIQMRGFYE